MNRLAAAMSLAAGLARRRTISFVRRKADAGRQRRWRRAGGVLLIALAACATAGPAPGAEPAPAASQADSALQFRRVFVPAGEIQDWPKGSVKYLPIEAREFDRLLEVIGRTPAGQQGQVAARVVAARYQARATDDRRIVGTAKIEIACREKTAVLLPLEPCNLAVSTAAWEDPPGPATLGLGSDGRLRVLVERSGTLGLEWSLRAQPGAAEEDAEYRMDLPTSPISHFSLDLPEKLTPQIDPGAVLGSAAVEGGGRRWQLELGGPSSVHVRLASGAPAQPRAGLVLWRQSATYDVSLRGLELSSEIKLEAYREPLSAVVLLLEPPLELVHAQLDGAAVSWQPMPAPAADARPAATPPGRGPAAGSSPPPPARLLLKLPQPLGDGRGVLELKATAATVTDHSWQLPRLRMAGLLWQEGRTNLRVLPPLGLEQVHGEFCRQSAVEPALPQGGYRLGFENFSPDAALAVTLAQGRPAVHSASGISTELGDSKMTSRVVTAFRIAEGSRFSLEAAVAPQWTIDSVESLPADALDDWTLSGRRKLTVSLARPLTPARSVRLMVAARRLFASPGRNLGRDDLVPLRFQPARGQERLLALRAAGPYELRLDRAEHLHRVERADLTAVEKELLSRQPGELIFRDDAEAEGIEVSLDKRKPMYTATIRVEALALGEMLQETYLLTCAVAKAGEVDRILVRLAHRRREPVHWSLEGDEAAVSARRVPPRPTAPGERAEEGETWELLLRHPAATALEIRGLRESRFPAPTPINLASLPEAASQQATLVVRSDGARALHIQNHRLKPLAAVAGLPAASADQYPTARATYQYDPGRDTVDDPEPPLVLAPGGQSALPTAWAWSCEVRSRYAADGAEDHLAAYRVESAGGRRLRVTLPAGTTRPELRGVWIDQNRAFPHVEPGAEPPELVVDLPAGKRLASVEIAWTVQRDGLGAVTVLEPPTPQADVPVLARHWTVQLPPGYEACDFIADRVASPRRVWSWSQRLFGVLGRAADQPPFNPLARNDWLRAGEAAPAPSQAEAVASPADCSGWVSYRLDLADLAHGRVGVVHIATIHAVGWLMFLSAAAVGLWKLGGRSVLATALAGALGIVAMMCSSCFIPIASAALLGVLFCLAAGLVRRVRGARPAGVPQGPDGPEQDMPSTISGVLPSGMAVLLVAALSWANPLAAAAPPAKTPPPSPYSLLVPIDAQEKPTGGKYYLPESLYEQLYLRAGARVEKPQGWLIAGGVYRAALSKEASSQRWLVDQLTADFALRVFDAAVRVRIPFHRDEATLLPDQSQLDGQPIQPEWDADGGSLLVDVAEPGDYRLELALRPTTHGAAGGFDLAVPRLANARLELALPAGAPLVELPRAVGAVRREEQPPRLLADLGPADRLVVRWPDPAAETVPAVNLEQLLWMRVAPGSVVLDARLRFSVVAGALRRVSLLADPRLEMLPLAGTNAPAARMQRPKGQAQTIELTWPRPISDATTVNARFVCTGGTPSGSGIGLLRLPQLEALDVRPTGQWLALSVDPALDYQISGGSRAEVVPAAEFLGSWGAAAAAPQWACRLPPGPAAWSLSTHPQQPETTAEGTLGLAFDGQHAEVRLEAQLLTTSGSLLQQRIILPPALVVERVSLQTDGTERAARWAQAPGGTVTVFLSAPVSGRSNLSLSGVLPVPLGERVILPVPVVEAAHTQSLRVEMFRRPAVLLQVEHSAGWAEVKDRPADPRMAGLGRAAQCFQTQQAAPGEMAVRVLPNRPQGRGEQITRLSWDEDGWKAAVDCRLEITAGVLDEIVIDAPPAWNGPFQSSADVALKIVEGPAAGSAGYSGRRLLLEPRLAVSGANGEAPAPGAAEPARRAGSFHFTVSGPLEFAPSDHVVIPEVLLGSIGPLRRVLILPKQAEGQPVAWETQGLRELAATEATAETTAYEIVAEPWKARLQPAAGPKPPSRIRLADVRMAWQAGDRCRGLALLDVEIGESAELPLWLPAGARLLHLTTGGVLVDPIRTRQGAWLVPLAADPQPQRLEVLFDADADAAQSPSPLAGEGASEAESPPEAATMPAPPGPALQTLRRPIPLVWATRRVFHAPKLGDLPVERTVWTIAGPQSAGLGDPENADLVEPEPAAEEEAAAPRPKPPSLPAGASGLRSAPGGEGESLWPQAMERGQAIARYAGHADSLTLRYAPVETNGWLARLAAVALIGLLAVGAVVLVERGTLWHGFARWPHAFGVALGLGWWLFLRPSGLGLLIVFAVLAAQFLPRRVSKRGRGL
jgi:hypothetical protein